MVVAYDDTDAAIEFIRDYYWLTNCVVDYFINNIKLPAAFNELLTLDVSDLVELAKSKDTESLANETLREFIRCCKIYALDRRPESASMPPPLTNALAQGLNKKKQMEVSSL
jgi:hypothetical protein